MKIYRIIVIVCLGGLLSNCADEFRNLDQEDISRTELILSADDYGPYGKEIANIKATVLGRKLFQGIAIPITLVYKPDLGKRAVGYLGNGKIGYCFLSYPAEPILFHELFHVFQTRAEVVASRNNEIEAYVAQYLFCKSVDPVHVDDVFEAISASFEQLIKQLADYAEWNTSSQKNSQKFHELYSRALAELRESNLYGTHTNYTEEREPYSFPNLYLLLNVIK